MGDTAEIKCVLVNGDDERFDSVVGLAATILDQDRYLLMDFSHAHDSYVVGAFHHDEIVGFLRFLVQDIGAAEGRPPVYCQGKPITEVYIEAFGVHPGWRRRGVGTSLQRFAMDHAVHSGCYQMRSRSPVTSTENYALKIAAGHAVQPSEQNDSYYFIKKL